jgi:hypothetical protein
VIIDPRMEGTVYAHAMVAHLAEELAQALYEEAAKDNDWFQANPDRNIFVKVWAPKMIPEARSQLTDMLSRNDVPEDHKELIFDALKADREIPRSGVAVEH